jgi:glycosyltransferase involved in cell wall biosynthesis
MKPLQGHRSLANRSYTAEEATGILTQPGDAEGMALGIEWLLSNNFLRHQLSANAKADAGRRFDLQTQAKSYLEWYQSIMQKRCGSSVEETARISM